MLTRILLTGLTLVLLSYKKENHGLKEKVPAIELLTQKPWILASHGLDDNGNDQIDPAEEGIEDCQRDNTTKFYPDGTGLFDDNAISCGTGVDNAGFNWAFTERKTEIDFRYDSLGILRLTDHELVLCKVLISSNNDNVKFIIRYTH